MKLGKVAAISILAVFVLIFSGCSGGNGNVGPSTTPFQGGTTALSMDFREGTPPSEIYDAKQYPFSIDIQIENLGENDVKASDGYVEITGIEATEFGLSGQAALKKPFPGDIRGVKKNFQGTVLIGDMQVVEFTDLNFQRDIRGNWDGPRIRANLCYNYETEATTAICLKKDMLTNIDTKEICALTGDKKTFNSGAPIQVTKAYQTPLGSGKVQVQFEISHVGTPNDRFYKFSTDCDDRSTNLNKDKVFIEIPTNINGVTAKCSGLQETTGTGNSGYVTLYRGKPSQVVCSFDVGNIQGSYEKQISVLLKYRYYQFIEKNILVKDVSTGSS